MGTSEEFSVGRFISILSRYWQTHLDRTLKPLNIGSAQIPILMFLFNHEPVAQSAIVAHLRTNKGATARTIRRLVDEGYVVRAPDPDDGRAYRISLTPKAHAIKGALREILRHWTHGVSKDFSEAERALVVELLGRMVLAAEALLQDTGEDD
ncbi:MAG: hypothetical protein AUK47_25470 [Deltaproteobacteria bacterium CG2_30_63_29]|nr:MAG: hypothetical protein AUK47_25470 [Deltaproteobacteria bacterium CG2_30_63_29]PIW01102.1 MAG: MarR family transcriptional regulator [Deltaproteobacteria bacterium CG17_big_fil_post_rev_8_21_14_2_50_63_7]PJB42370.1 MAG: MarR family transcriptional regulator [Deltaproteobacteria bacterium CG_4_9_14_3_um_filter_63_12]